MKFIAQVKLLVTNEQADALRETMREANACCDRLSAWAWENRIFGKFPIQKARYAQERADSGLTAQVVIRCISKTADAYRLDKKAKREFRPNGSIAYDDRILTWYTRKDEVSIWTVNGRLKLPFVCGDYQRSLLEFRQGESDLCCVDGQFYLLATVSLPDPPLMETDGIIGVDLGIVNLATDSEGNAHSGESVKACRRRIRKRRAGLQKCGSRRAKRTLKKMSRKASRFCKHVNHVISRRLVEAARNSRKALALENLSGIRERADGFSREMRWQLGNWSFNQLAQFIVYKAQRVGVPVVFVDPRNTSRTCSECGYCAKENRTSQSQFFCQFCGLQINADVNASRNIARRGLEARGLVTGPMGATA